MTMVMNRTQRRAQMRNEKQRQVKILPNKIGYGHNGECVVMLFEKPTDAVAFTPEQVEAVIKSLAESKNALLAHKNG